MNENITSQATANLLDIDIAKQVTSLMPLVGWKRALDFVNQSHQQKLETDVILVFLLLTLNVCFDVSIVDFEQVNASWY